MALPAFGFVVDQKQSKVTRYDPGALTKSLQQEILEYWRDPPRTRDNQTRFLTVLTARQMGKSLSVEYAAYLFAAYNPGWDHVCDADTKDRALYLHQRVHLLHEHWAFMQSPTIPQKERRKLTFSKGGAMRVRSANDEALGLGQSPDSYHASECGFWNDFAGAMGLINPSLVNRDEIRVTFECTPWEANGDWHRHCQNAKKEQGRHCYLFRPFWDGHLNQRTWLDEWSLDTEEIRLLERFATGGLTKEHLAFRRFMMEQDEEIRRNPELFKVYYPFDDIGCWVMGIGSAIPAHALRKHLDRVLAPWAPGDTYREYEAPQDGAIYAIGVDPCGHAARDHASFQVLKVWSDGWEQVATYAGHTDPLAFANEVRRVGLRFNRALVVVENNGVGQGVLTHLRAKGYPNLYHEKKGQPGKTTSAQSLKEMLGWLTDALLDKLVLLDSDTVDQLQTYKQDKIIEESERSELIRGGASRKRRARHHWDKVSALMMAVVAARLLPQRPRPKALEPTPESLDPDRMTWAQWEKHTAAIDKARKKKKRGWYGASTRNGLRKGGHWKR